MVLSFWVELSELIMFPSIKRKKKRMKRYRGKRGRSEESAALSRGVNVLVVLRASSLMMRRELQTQAGVLRKIEVQKDGHMTRLRILGRIANLAHGVDLHGLITRKRSKSLTKIQEILKQKPVK